MTTWNDPPARALAAGRRQRALDHAKREPLDHLLYLVQVVMVYDVDTDRPEHETVATCGSFDDAKCVAERWARNEDVALVGIHDLDQGDVELVKGAWS
jgi:hypothetical protein